MGPSAIRYAGLRSTLTNLGYTLIDHGNIHVQGHYTLASTTLASRLRPIQKGCERVYAVGREAIAAGEIPLFLGGDHSIAIGTVGGVTHARQCGVIWVDAHGDFNTPATTPSGNVHGMALATLMGHGSKRLVNVGRKGPKIDAENLVLLGVRELDGQEKALLKSAGCSVFTMQQIDEMGIFLVLQRALTKLRHLPTIHLSLDVDVLDPREAPGVGTPSTGGLTYREAQLIMETIADTGKLQSADVVEVNPILDHKNQTAQLAVELLGSLFGKNIF